MSLARDNARKSPHIFHSLKICRYQSGADMTSLRKYSLAGGIFYLLTFVSIPTLALYRSVRGPNFVVGSGPDTPVIVGVLLEMIVAIANIGTAVALYPVVKRVGE